MKFNIISNLTPGIGLYRDYLIVRAQLEKHNHQVEGVMWRGEMAPPADVNIFLEVFNKELFPAAKRQWIIPNPEWWGDEHSAFLDSFDLIICKTEDSRRLFSKMVNGRSRYTGFESYDHFMPDVKRENRFLHVAGNSRVKNTESVLAAWQRYEIPYPLTLLTNIEGWRQQAATIPNVTVLDHIEESELRLLHNSHRFHICPSKYEGWGHSLHEGQGVGAIVLTSDAPPMNEIAGISPDLLIGAMREQKLRLADLVRVTPEAIVEKVHLAIQLTESQLSALSVRARHGFESDRMGFRERFGALLC